MRRPFRMGPWFCALAVAGTTAPSVVYAQPAEEAPEELYDQGRKAYRVGDFQTALDKWERAYDLSDNGLLLYNISLAYRGLYTITKDIGDLRRARVVLDNFIKVAQSDPSIDEDDAPQKLAELDAQIVDAEEKATRDKQSANPPTPLVLPEARQSQQQPSRGPDSGRTLRLTGIGMMVSGGAVALTGAGLALFYAIKGREFSDLLATNNNEFDQAGCDPRMPQGMNCLQLQENIDTYRANGRQANVLAAGLGATLGGVGVVAVVAGVLVYKEGNKRTKQWEQGLGSLKIGPWGRGISVSGRF